MFLDEGQWSKKTVGLSLLLLTFYSYHAWSYSFLNDDAYISFRYAAHWVDFGELSYNLGERTEGYTNFLWVALLALGYLLGGDIPQLSLYLSIGLAMFTVLGSALYSSRLEHDVQRKVPRVLMTLSLLALSPSFACWSTGGLEVQLFTACYSLALILSARAWRIQELVSPNLRQKLLGGGWAGLALALASMARPEGLLLFAVLGFYRILKLLQIRAWLKSCDYGAIIGFSIIYLPYFMWRYEYYGYIFPNTYYAKVGASGFWAPGIRYVAEFLVFQPWLMIALGLMTYAKMTNKTLSENVNQSRFQNLWLIALLTGLAHCIHVARVGGDFMALHRFLVPLLPLAAIFASKFLLYSPKLRKPGPDHFDQIENQESQEQKPLGKELNQAFPNKALVLRLGFLISLGVMSMYIHEDANRIGSRNGVDSIGWLRQFAEQCATTGQFIQQHTDPQVKLATTAAGALPFYAQRYTVDLLGLNDEWIAHHVPARGHRPGHTKSAPFRYPIDQKVDLLIYHPSFSKRASRPSSRMKRALNPFGYEWQSYQVPQLQPNWWNVWVKNGVEIDRALP